MKREEILNTIKMLAQSQGFYGRLLNNLLELDGEEYDKIMAQLEEQNFRGSVDLVIFLEN